MERAVALIVLALAGACSTRRPLFDDGASSTDAALPIDAIFTEGGHLIPCVISSDCSDPAEPICAVDATPRVCVQCLTSADCASSPFGPRCTNNRCTCLTDAECPRGHCTSSRCGCATNADCTRPPFTRCQRSSGELHCDVPCSADHDCDEPGLTRCAADGRCVQCLGDSDCTWPDNPFCSSLGFCGSCRTDGDCRTGPPPWASASPAPFCQVGVLGNACVPCAADGDCPAGTPVCDQGYCVECRANSDCASSPSGARCRGGGCGCSTNADCAGERALGAVCDVPSPLPLPQAWVATYRCTCTQDSHCKDKTHGPICLKPLFVPGPQHCACTSSGQCTAPPFTVCTAEVPFTAATLYVCAEPCANGCPCATGADCAQEPFRILCYSGRCIECITDADCGPSSLGNTCGAYAPGFCSCETTADCSGNQNGNRCDGYLKTCGCLTDIDCPPPHVCTGSNPNDPYNLTAICQ